MVFTCCDRLDFISFRQDVPTLVWVSLADIPTLQRFVNLLGNQISPEYFVALLGGVTVVAICIHNLA